MSGARYTLAIDFGSTFIGLALVRHTAQHANQPLYAATLNVAAKPLNELSENRAAARRIRRTRKTHRRRLERLTQALQGIPGAAEVIRFCRRRGFSHDVDEADEDTEIAFRVSRDQFFSALRAEVEQACPVDCGERVMELCARHLNRQRLRDRELRPARFENRGPTKCNWEGCRRNVPRAGNAVECRLQQALFVWLKPIFAESADPVSLRRSMEHWIAELGALSRAMSKLTGEDKKELSKPLQKRKQKVYKLLLGRIQSEASPETTEQFAQNWTDYYRDDVNDLVTGKSSGRTRYCREHSRSFVDQFLAGAAIPNRTDVSEADLVSRKQQILFRKLWRLIESRLVPLAGGRIDRLIVERVAFDVLAGKRKNREELPEKRAAEMYWQGPQFGFINRLEMLKAEFNGKCVYCNAATIAGEAEHMMPRSQFPFDSYFNLVPACQRCNAQKGSQSPLAACMRVTPEAYEAYCQYVRTRRVPHVFHHIKKGLLNLLQRPGSEEKGEQLLGMLANDLVRVTNTQRSPRPLARYLAGKLRQATGTQPEVSWQSGRHTALYRGVCLPDYDKPAEKESGDVCNHAVDAIMLGCEFPSAAALENPLWNGRKRGIWDWMEQVRECAPQLGEDLPLVEAPVALTNFEQEIAAGYFSIDLSAFNWNQQRRRTHLLDPFGTTATGQPVKRIPAANVLEELVGDVVARGTQIQKIAHHGLRQLLEARPDQAAAEFVSWLQASCGAGLKGTPMGKHPADQERRTQLEEFVATPAAIYLTKEKTIPAVIGVKCLNMGSAGKIDVTRSDCEGNVYQWFQSQPAVRELYVGYRLQAGKIDRTKPELLFVDQAFRLKIGPNRTLASVPPESPLAGRSQGDGSGGRAFRTAWQVAFDDYCRELGLVKVFRLRQGCFIEKEDGSRFQMRNFDKGKSWMKAASFKGIRRVYRSPLASLDQKSVGKLS